ncbi:MAG: type II secretion system protein GspL, partial [Gammaproteobacteria bacterium]|nr:type II secretion system protein GspL [Gammaproteobacteria bacterium]
MSQVFIRIDESHSSPEQLNAAWMRVDNEGQASPITRGPLSEAANQTLGAKVVLLVPSNDILLTQVAIPTQNRQRLLKAIPYAVEDQVIGDVEDMHFAVGERDDEKGYMTAVVDRRKMDYWQAQLLQNGLIADYVIPDVLAIPAQDDGWGLVVEEQTTLVRNQRYPSFAVDTENLGRVLPLAVKEVGEDLPGHITAWQCAANEQDVARIIPVVDERIELRTEECPKGLLGLIADNGFDAKTSLNLLQGDYSRREQVGKYLRPWFLTSILFGIWFVIQLALAITQGFTFNSELDQLRT